MASVYAVYCLSAAFSMPHAPACCPRNLASRIKVKIYLASCGKPDYVAKIKQLLEETLAAEGKGDVVFEAQSFEKEKHYSKLNLTQPGEIPNGAVPSGYIVLHATVAVVTISSLSAD
jgi:hypothetical protein